eukprot:scpid92873/ scgid8394/ 
MGRTILGMRKQVAMQCALVFAILALSSLHEASDAIPVSGIDRQSVQKACDGQHLLLHSTPRMQSPLTQRAAAAECDRLGQLLPFGDVTSSCLREKCSWLSRHFNTDVTFWIMGRKVACSSTGLRVATVDDSARTVLVCAKFVVESARPDSTPATASPDASRDQVATAFKTPELEPAKTPLPVKDVKAAGADADALSMATELSKANTIDMSMLGRMLQSQPAAAEDADDKVDSSLDLGSFWTPPKPSADTTETNSVDMDTLISKALRDEGAESEAVKSGSFPVDSLLDENNTSADIKDL